jgi:hypothetical protein
MPVVECAARANIPVTVFFPQEHPLYALRPGVTYSDRVEIPLQCSQASAFHKSQAPDPSQNGQISSKPSDSYIVSSGAIMTGSAGLLSG